MNMCLMIISVDSCSLQYNCSYQNEKPSSFVTAIIECNLFAMGVPLTQGICPSRYGLFQDLGLRSPLSALDHHVEVSCVRCLAGRLQYLCVISSYELLGSGLETLELNVGSNPNRPKHTLSSHGWGGEREGPKPLPNFLTGRSKKKLPTHAHVLPSKPS